MQDKIHIPVMLPQALDYLNLRPGSLIVDATVGAGGHALEIIKRILPKGRLIGIDRDGESLAVAKERLSGFGQACEFVQGSFMDVDDILSAMHIKKVDGFLFDLGISSLQLSDPKRGFSFQAEGPLDMRLDRDSYISAYDLVNNLNEEEISSLLWNFGQERWHNRIARLLVQERQSHPITTTHELSDIVIRATPHKYRHYRIHPATRTFQAMRIAVNRELETLETAMDKIAGLLSRAGRVCVISFHSLEDRIVKLKFKELAYQGLMKILTPKPLTPGPGELADNPSSRSSKLRAAERL